MLVKRAVYYVLAAGPFLLLGFIAINSRMSSNHWEFVEYGPETTKRIEAYVGPVTISRQAIFKGRVTSPDALRQAIDAWITASRAGALKDITPATTLSEGSTPVYEQILDARRDLAEVTLRQANLVRNEGRLREAAYLYADVLEIANVAKYSEFSSLSDAAAYQIAALNRLSEIASELDRESRIEIIARIESLDSDPDRSLIHIVDTLSVAYSRDLLREGRASTTIEAAREQRRLASNEDPLLARIEGWQQMALTDRTLISMYGRCGTAYRQQSRYHALVEETCAEFEYGLEASSD